MTSPHRSILALVVGLAFSGVGARAQDAAAVAAGKSVFQLRCAPCHGAGRIKKQKTLSSKRINKSFETI